MNGPAHGLGEGEFNPTGLIFGGFGLLALASRGPSPGRQGCPQVALRFDGAGSGHEVPGAVILGAPAPDLLDQGRTQVTRQVTPQQDLFQEGDGAVPIVGLPPAFRFRGLLLHLGHDPTLADLFDQGRRLGPGLGSGKAVPQFGEGRFREVKLAAIKEGPTLGQLTLRPAFEVPPHQIRQSVELGPDIGIDPIAGAEFVDLA